VVSIAFARASHGPLVRLVSIGTFPTIKSDHEIPHGYHRLIVLSNGFSVRRRSEPSVMVSGLDSASSAYQDRQASV
jgi:hypothetical protein